MKTYTSYIRLFLILRVAQCCTLQCRYAEARDLSTSLPAAIEKGFHLLTTAGPPAAFDA